MQLYLRASPMHAFILYHHYVGDRKMTLLGSLTELRIAIAVLLAAVSFSLSSHMLS